jgi:hypothetical protein
MHARTFDVPPIRWFVSASPDLRLLDVQGAISVLVRSRLAILVYQGSDPTEPYPALVIRQSATLQDGFAPWGIDGVVRLLVRFG